MCDESYAFPRYWHPAELQRSFEKTLNAGIVRDCLKARIELLNGIRKRKIQAHHFEPLSKEGAYFDNLSFYLLNAAVAAKYGIDSPAYEHYMKVEKDFLRIRFRNLKTLSLPAKLDIIASLFFAEQDVKSAMAPISAEEAMDLIPSVHFLSKEDMSQYITFYYSTGWRLKNKHEGPYDPSDLYATLSHDDFERTKRDFKEFKLLHSFKFSLYDLNVSSVQTENKEWAMPKQMWEPITKALTRAKERERVFLLRSHKDLLLKSHKDMRASYNEEIYRAGVDGQNPSYKIKEKVVRDCWVGMDFLDMVRSLEKLRHDLKRRYIVRPPGVAYMPLGVIWCEKFICDLAQPAYAPSKTAVEWMKRNWCNDIASLCKFSGEGPLYLVPMPSASRGVSVKDKQLEKLEKENATANFSALEPYLPPCMQRILKFDTHLGFNTYAVVYNYYKAMGLTNKDAMFNYVYQNKPRGEKIVKLWEERIKYVTDPIFAENWKWESTCENLSSLAVKIRSEKPEFICPYSKKGGPKGCCEAQFGDDTPVTSKRFLFPWDFTLFRFEQVKQQVAIEEAHMQMQKKREALAKAKEEFEQTDLKHKAKCEVVYEQEPVAMDTN